MIIKKREDLLRCGVYQEGLYRKFIVFCEKYYNIESKGGFTYQDLSDTTLLFVNDEFVFDAVGYLNCYPSQYTIMSEQDVEDSITYLELINSQKASSVSPLTLTMCNDVRKDILLEVSQIAQDIGMNICFYDSGDIVLLDQESNEYLIKSRADLDKIHAAKCVLEGFIK